MTEAAQNALLAMIVREWQALPPVSQPWGVWVRRYPPLPPDADGLETAAWPQAVWFLDAGGLRGRSVWEWRRFWAMHCEQTWCAKFWAPEPSGVFGRRHEIGLAAFAAYAGWDGYYLESVWGGLLGHGWVVGVSEAGGVLSSRGLWIS